ncbi:hypothetical protein [Kitasatospora sp. NBC_01539]|uniref:hypothetical protein n=1 Tax=Kitasatospora sp. NBC_01539 TaxID=2903577 RepID=UPI00386010EF
MPEPQHTDPVAQFTRQLNHLVAALDPGEGWYAFLLQQDERAVRAYLDGTSVPPWDVVSSLLDDSDHKRGVIEGARDRARDLHRAAVGAHDRRIGRPALLGRLDTARDERDEAAAQLRRLYEPRPGGSSRPQPTADLFPARDRHERASARFLELEARLAFLDAALAAEPGASAPHPPPAATRRTARAASAALAAIAFGAPQVQEPEARAVLPQPVADPAVAAAAVGAARSATVRLADLRAKGLGGQAHIALCEAVTGPDGHTVALLRELETSGQAAEIPTLLWEAASLPPARLAALACALCDADREADARTLLRNASSRPAADLTAAASALLAAHRGPQLDMLLEPLLRTRRYQQAVLIGQQETALVPALLDSARRMSEQHGRELSHALRAGGLGTAVP